MAGEEQKIMNVVIVDDEEEARDLLRIMLRSRPDFRVVGDAAHVDEAVRITSELRPDLVFLDIQMPGKDGFDYLNEIRKNAVAPGIIFVTAFENYAVQAIRNAAFDYLLKPVNKVELFNALDRFAEMFRRNKKSEISALVQLLDHSKPDRLRLNTRTGYVFVDTADILYCEADGNYSYIWLTSGKKETSTLNLGSIMKLLDSGAFLRISRSYLVNMHYLSRVDRKMNTCELQAEDTVYTLKVPSQNIRILEEYFD
jgi:DNA-binding LytR/AlgR family response regulator